MAQSLKQCSVVISRKRPQDRRVQQENRVLQDRAELTPLLSAIRLRHADERRSLFMTPACEGRNTRRPKQGFALSGVKRYVHMCKTVGHALRDGALKAQLRLPG